MKQKMKAVLSAIMVMAMLVTAVNLPAVYSKAAAPELSIKKITIEKGKTKKITVQNAPKSARMKWSSSNKKVVKVSRKGKITGIKKGSAKVTCRMTYRKNGKKAVKKFRVKVTVRAAMKLSMTKASLKRGQTVSVSVNRKPKGAKVTWSSANSKIAKVSRGKITGVANGTTKITARVKFRENKKNVVKKLTVKVTVTGAAGVEKPVSTPVVTATPTPAPATPTPIPVEVSNLGEEHISANGIVTKDNGQMRKDLDASQMMYLMGQGINIGNTLEARLDDSVITDSTTVYDYEKAWGNPLITQECLDGMKYYGYQTVRVPVAWSNMISDDGTYTIDESYLDRVEEVINYALNQEMYVIINIHWDGGWWGQFGSADEAVRAEGWKRYEAFWKQISERYKEYSDRLIFESANEELGDRLNDEIDGVKGSLDTAQQYQMTNEINQKFVDIVRASGGNNQYRHLLIAGFSTDIDKTSDDRFQMPKDTEENGKKRMSVSVHYYTPSTYCIVEQDMGWGFSDTWGTDNDIAELHRYFDKMTKFTEEGYGVIIGEYGVAGVNKDGIPAFLNEVATYGKQLGFCPVLWEIGSLYDRNSGVFKYKDVAQVYIDATGSDALAPEDGAVTGIPVFEWLEDDQAELKYTWEGKWVKNDGSNEHRYYEQTGCSEGMNVFCNAWQYYLYISADWENMTKPCIKAYLEDNTLSKDSSIQIEYIDYVDGVPDNSGDKHNNPMVIQADRQWAGKCIVLDRDALLENDALYLSFGNGVTVTKIEIYDQAVQ